MKNIEENMIQRIEEQFTAPNELARRQISVFLKPDTIQKLDQVTEQVKLYSEKKITRNSMIELAVDILVDCAPKALKNYKEKNEPKKEEFDTVVFPCDETGVETFIRTKSWFYVRTEKSKISKLKYIALYTGSPKQCITHYGVIDSYEPRNFNGKTKYIYYLKGEPMELDHPIVLGNINPQCTRSPKYTTLKKLKSAQTYSDLDI